MTRIFGRLGTNFCEIAEISIPPSDGLIEMREVRPSSSHICQIDQDSPLFGIWVLPPMSPAQLKANVTAFRWEVETGGITLPTGVRVATGIDDQNRITSVVANAERAGMEEVDFKAAEGWAKVTLAELQAIATAVALHVQACFSAERTHHEAIDALALIADPQERQAALDAYDESQGWPSVAPQ